MWDNDSSAADIDDVLIQVLIRKPRSKIVQLMKEAEVYSNNNLHPGF